MYERCRLTSVTIHVSLYFFSLTLIYVSFMLVHIHTYAMFKSLRTIKGRCGMNQRTLFWKLFDNVAISIKFCILFTTHIVCYPSWSIFRLTFDQNQMLKRTPNVTASMGGPILLIFGLVRRTRIGCLNSFAIANDVMGIETDKIQSHLPPLVYGVRVHDNRYNWWLFTFILAIPPREETIVQAVVDDVVVRVQINRIATKIWQFTSIELWMLRIYMELFYRWLNTRDVWKKRFRLVDSPQQHGWLIFSNKCNPKPTWF